MNGHNMLEIHPVNTESATPERIKKVSWRYKVNPKLFDDVFRGVIKNLPKKRIYLLFFQTDVLMGFYPKLTEREETLLGGLTANIESAYNQPTTE